MKKKLRNSFRLMAFGLWVIAITACQPDKKHEETNSVPSAILYTCPMPEDSFFSDKPGTCPKCGMDLIKVVEKTAHTEHTHVFTCPMHPEIIRNEPGQCPICGMDLVEKMESTGGQKLGLGAIIEPVNKTVLSSIKTIRPEEQNLSLKINASGYMTYNPQNSYGVAIRYAGRIEKLYVKYNFQYIKRGQKIMDIYSPELLTAQQNFVFLLNSDPGNASLVESSKQQLRLLGIDERQIKQLEKTKKAERVVSVYSPKDGHVHEMQQPTDLTMSNMQMGSQAKEGMNTSASSEGEFSIREGIYLTKGQTLFSIISTEKLWAILKIYPEDVSNIKLHQAVELYSEMQPNVVHKGRVDFLEPSYDPQSRYLTVRIYLDHGNHNNLKIGSLIKGNITSSVQMGIWVPKKAVLNLGNLNYVVFLKNGSAFTTKKITPGNVIGDKIQVIDGLTKENEIAYDAQYLIDSEGFVQ